MDLRVPSFVMVMVTLFVRMEKSVESAWTDDLTRLVYVLDEGNYPLSSLQQRKTITATSESVSQFINNTTDLSVCNEVMMLLKNDTHRGCTGNSGQQVR